VVVAAVEVGHCSIVDNRAPAGPARPIAQQRAEEPPQQVATRPETLSVPIKSGLKGGRHRRLNPVLLLFLRRPTRLWCLDYSILLITTAPRIVCFPSLTTTLSSRHTSTFLDDMMDIFRP
jgi:hypothetical protein